MVLVFVEVHLGAVICRCWPMVLYGLYALLLNLLKNICAKMLELAKSPVIQFLINPSTLFVIAGLLVAKYEDDIEPVHSPHGALSNATFPIPLDNNLETYAGKYAPNHTILESYHLVDPVAKLEMNFISHILQLHDNSSQWRFKFVELPTFHPVSGSTQVQQRKANVLVTDSQERVPIWAVVNLNTFKVESWTMGKQGVGTEEISEEAMLVAGEVALADASVLNKIRSVGTGKLREVIPDVWDAGYLSNSSRDRLVQIFFYGIHVEDGEYFAFPLNFVVYVELSKNSVWGIEDLSLYINPDNKSTAQSSAQKLTVEVMLPPNTVRSELLYRLKGPRTNLPSLFQVSGSEELHR